MRIVDMPKRAVLAMLAGYKRWVSPAFPPACRYVPTCSEYAAEAVEYHGVVRGGLMAAWRLLRCTPFVKGGYDPVKKVASGQLPVASCCVAEHAEPPDSTGHWARGTGHTFQEERI